MASKVNSILLNFYHHFFRAWNRNPTWLLRAPGSAASQSFFPTAHLSIMPGVQSCRPVFLFVPVIIILFAAFLNCGCPSGNTGTGTVTGTISIGPLCLVEPCTVSNDRLVAAYAARPITISTQGGTVVAAVIADPKSGYVVSLTPGTYVIDIRHEGIGGSRELPATVTIRSGETVRLDISIDTGIR